MRIGLGRWNAAERLVLGTSVAVLVAVVVLALAKSVPVAWGDYALIAVGAVLLLVLGQAYRCSGRSERIGRTAIAVGLLLMFPGWITVLNYLLLPYPGTPIDETLARIDALVGYDYPSWVAWMGQYPWLNHAALVAYNSSLPQLAVLVVVLGFAGTERRLSTFLLLLLVTSLMTLTVWLALPTNGVGSVRPIPAEIEAAVRPLVTTDYAMELVRMATEGADRIAPDAIKGLISFPSYHTVMALACVWAAWPFRWLRWPVLALNAMVLYGTVGHGGHHLIDLPAGALTFWLGLAMARRLLAADGTPTAVASSA